MQQKIGKVIRVYPLFSPLHFLLTRKKMTQCFTWVGIVPMVNGMPHSTKEFNGNIHLSSSHAVIFSSRANGNSIVP